MIADILIRVLILGAVVAIPAGMVVEEILRRRDGR